MTERRRRCGRTLLATALAAAACCAVPASEREPVAEALEGLTATFVLYDRSADRWVRHDPARASVRFSPCSTFKIPNSLIGLETGVIDGPDIPVPHDPASYPRQPHHGDRRWAVVAQPHTLRSAIRNSVVWYYRKLATAVGPARMQHHLHRFDYGNRDMSSGVDRFWLSRSLAISADEQVEFLQRF